jgi:methylated-DNA-protein-cysteine methyltransferase-like protein
MPHRPGKARVRTELLALVRDIPFGHVASADMLASKLGLPPPMVATMLSQLAEDKRDVVPWHRVVAKGGAIGRGPHRERQFARLVQEGVVVSPAGVVQDLPRVMTRTFDGPIRAKQSQPDALPQPAKPGGQSRGMKSRP